MTYDWIGFLSDYGRRDGFVASCHGVIATIAPDVRMIDITHEVPAQDVRHGAAVLAQTVPFLPPAVHLAVVDPGVGTDRRPIALETPGGLLVGPDNGLLRWAAEALGGVGSAVEIADRRYRLSTTSRTFDGRDVFAPAAAHLAAGVPLADLGPALRVTGLARLADPEIRVHPGLIDTEVLTVDHFGNIQLAALVHDLSRAGLGEDRVRVTVADTSYDLPVGAAFAVVPPENLLLYVDASDHIAIAVNRGSAAARLAVGAGDPVRIATPARDAGDFRS